MIARALADFIFFPSLTSSTSTLDSLSRPFVFEPRERYICLFFLTSGGARVDTDQKTFLFVLVWFGQFPNRESSVVREKKEEKKTSENGKKKKKTERRKKKSAAPSHHLSFPFSLASPCTPSPRSGTRSPARPAPARTGSRTSAPLRQRWPSWPRRPPGGGEG